MEQAIDFVLADELTHVRFGSDWVREFTKNDPGALRGGAGVPPPGRQAVQLRRLALGPRGRRDSDRARGPDRGGLHRGTSSTELAQISGDGPSRETLKAAGEILRQRHLAKRAAARGEAGMSDDTHVPRHRAGRAHHLRALLRVRDPRRPARAARPLRRRGHGAPRPQLPLRGGVDDDGHGRLARDGARGAGEDGPGQDHLGGREGRRRARQAAARAALRPQGGVGLRVAEPGLRGLRPGRDRARAPGPDDREARRASSTC